MSDRSVEQAKMSAELPALLDRLKSATLRLDQVEDEKSAANRAHTTAMNEVNAAQKALDATLERLRHIAPKDSDWARVGVHALRAVGIFLLALLPLTAQAWEPEYGSTAEVVTAAGVSLSDETGAIPAVRVSFNGPLALGDASLARIDLTLAFMGLPGEQVDIRQPTTWKSAEVFGELQRRVGSDGQGGSTYVVARAGFHTRVLPRDKEPRERFARSYGLGVRIERRDDKGSIRRSLALLYGRSDVASPRWGKGQVMVEGHAKLAGLGPVDLIVGGDAYLNVSRTLPAGARDVMRAWVGISWGG